ncbi:Pimeloyl-ACP methyl ester carboxylesterase [Lentzea waywayandensis]|uniref:Pimeloyl-ACP methyl ester carboxylesterase n=1 Tax=Lentzea waywayandensis TaxID=84724 RepID=A0A1I6DIR8_9PSEU|nr:alpha/beta hydrolase [Lentzea waywayandensis]SFR05340.1 Pimeloyl-ACP methyl ester carboxylesterase [Lentzea waywayandensis]
MRANGVELCVETFGDPADPAVLLIHGACASMLWWESELCAAIAARGRFVIRYDNRDTGLSVSYPPGEPGYALSDLVLDAVGILDGLGVDRAHVVGRSMSGAIALGLGVDHADRLLSLTFVATTTGDPDLPPMTETFLEASGAQASSDVETIVSVLRAYAGTSPYFDEESVRALAVEDVARTVNVASAMTNHFQIEFDAPRGGGFGDISVPALVVHGSLDPVYPLAHGEALRDAIPGASLLVLDSVGHDLPRPVWPVFVDALVEHTA